ILRKDEARHPFVRIGFALPGSIIVAARALQTVVEGWAGLSLSAPGLAIDCDRHRAIEQGVVVTTNFRFGPFEARTAERVLLVDGAVCHIGSRAFDVLLALLERRERVVTKNELLDLAWPGLVVEENNLSVQISTLRKVLGAHAIATVTGRGY